MGGTAIKQSPVAAWKMWGVMKETEDGWGLQADGCAKRRGDHGAEARTLTVGLDTEAAAACTTGTVAALLRLERHGNSTVAA